MFKSKFAKAFVLGFCLTMISSGMALANTGNSVPGSPSDSVSSPVQVQPAVNEELLQKQQEIDRYLFEQHKEEIAQKGFTVTHTAPIDSYVVIGITPYNEENANYLYQIFGNEMVRVVEGQQAVTLNTAVGSADATVSSGAQGEPEVLADTTETNPVDNVLAGEEKAAESNSSMILPYAVGAAMLLGGSAIILRRMRMAGR